MRRPRGGAVVVPLLSLLVWSLVAVGQAAAERATVTDPGDDSALGPGSADITRVEVDHGRRTLRVVIHEAPRDGWADQYEVWVDTTPGHSGADLEVLDYHGAFGNIEGVFRVDRWRDQSLGPEVRCPGLTIDRFRDGGDHHPTIVFTVPRRCLGAPRELRVQVVSAQEHMINDYAPAGRRATRWLKSG